jgi:hypothetical protein
MTGKKVRDDDGSTGTLILDDARWRNPNESENPYDQA